ncbi:MAG: BolA family transcriptional regulator [Bradymonadaceae bacterium]|nr:BolA family transcriptional regulator [Lujinxingiaceae bacterium]
MIEPDAIVAKIQAAIPDAIVEAHDLTGTRDHYEVIVISQAFEGLTRIKRHRLVYEALHEEMKAAIHALTLQVYTPTQWEQAQ